MGSNAEMPLTTLLGIHQPANTEDESMSHKHYSMLRGHRLGFNPSAESHDLLFGRPISYYYKSKDKTGGRRTDWNSKQAATVIFPSLAATSMTVNFILAAL